MGLTSALNTSLNGLALNETTIDVLGNNIANAGTNGFKASETIFQTQLSRTLSVGSRATGENGGTNPQQIGLGASTAQIRKNFTQGSVTNSTSPSDLAIQGDGFFVLDGSDGTSYTRSGNFSLNSNDILVTPSGDRVQGWGVDDSFNIVTTAGLEDIEIPLGALNIAQETSEVNITGALLSVGELATQGSLLTTAALTQTSDGNPVSATTLLTDVDGMGFLVDDVVSFSPRKGGRNLEAQSLTVTATTTLAELTTMMENILGIRGPSEANGTAGIPQEGGVDPGVSITAGGVIQINGNRGEVNDISVTLGDLTRTPSGATVADTVPMSFTKTQSADGESSITDFIVYDSLGEEVEIKMTTYLESTNSASSTFRYFIESVDDSNADVSISSGTITFDSDGVVTDGGIQNFRINRADTAASDMNIDINFENVSGISDRISGSALTMQAQNGSPPGTLTRFVIDESGIINGVFDNGILRTLGQVALARFSNPQGLIESGDTNYQEGVASGPPFLLAPGSFGVGTLRSGSIELSNTDIGRSLVELIVASTNYRGNARVIDSIQQLTDELLVLGR